MHSFLSKVFGRKKDDKETSPTTLAPGELLEGRFEAVSPNVSPNATRFIELDPKVNGHDKEKDNTFTFFKAKSRPASPQLTTKKLDTLPHLSLNFSDFKERSHDPDLDVEVLLTDAVIGQRRLNPLEALVLIRACSQAIISRGLETLGVMHPHWYSSSPEIQRRLISHFLNSLAPQSAISPLSPTLSSPISAFESEIHFTRDPHDVATVLRWGLRHLQLEGDHFGTDDGWYKAFLDAESAAEYPPKAFSEKLAPNLPPAHLELLIATLEIFSSLAAHSEANSTSGSKLSKIFGLWLLTARRVEDKDDWQSFYSRWESTGRMLEHLFLARIRDESTDQRMPIRLLELVRKYPYTQGLSSPTTDLQLLPRPRLTTSLYDALFVRIEFEYPTESRKPKLKIHPLNLIADAFSANIDSAEYAELWAKITAASKNGNDPSPLSNIFADETIRFLSLVSDGGKGKEKEAKSPTFSLLPLSPPTSPIKRSFSAEDEPSTSTAAVEPAHNRFATDPISATPISPLAIGSDWAQFSSSGFLDSTPGIVPLVSTLFDTDIEKTVPPDPPVQTLSRKSSKRAKRKSVDVSGFATRASSAGATTSTEGEESGPTVKATNLEIIQFDEAFIDFWSDSLLDPITSTWPTFIICKFKSTLVPQLTYGKVEEGKPEKTLKWLILEQVYTVRPPSPPHAPVVAHPVADPELTEGARPSSPTASTSGKKRWFWSVSRTPSTSSATSIGDKEKGRKKTPRSSEMGELIEEEGGKIPSSPPKNRKSMDFGRRSIDQKMKSVDHGKKSLDQKRPVVQQAVGEGSTTTTNAVVAAAAIAATGAAVLAAVPEDRPVEEEEEPQKAVLVTDADVKVSALDMTPASHTALLSEQVPTSTTEVAAIASEPTSNEEIAKLEAVSGPVLSKAEAIAPAIEEEQVVEGGVMKEVGIVPAVIEEKVEETKATEDEAEEKVVETEVAKEVEVLPVAIEEEKVKEQVEKVAEGEAVKEAEVVPVAIEEEKVGEAKAMEEEVEKVEEDEVEIVPAAIEEEKVVDVETIKEVGIVPAAIEEEKEEEVEIIPAATEEKGIDTELPKEELSIVESFVSPSIPMVETEMPVGPEVAKEELAAVELVAPAIVEVEDAHAVDAVAPVVEQDKVAETEPSQEELTITEPIVQPLALEVEASPTAEGPIAFEHLAPEENKAEDVETSAVAEPVSMIENTVVPPAEEEINETEAAEPLPIVQPSVAVVDILPATEPEALEPLELDELPVDNEDTQVDSEAVPIVEEVVQAISVPADSASEDGVVVEREEATESVPPVSEALLASAVEEEVSPAPEHLQEVSAVPLADIDSEKDVSAISANMEVDAEEEKDVSVEGFSIVAVPEPITSNEEWEVLAVSESEPAVEVVQQQAEAVPVVPVPEITASDEKGVLAPESEPAVQVAEEKAEESVEVVETEIVPGPLTDDLAEVKKEHEDELMGVEVVEEDVEGVMVKEVEAEPVEEIAKGVEDEVEEVEEVEEVYKADKVEEADEVDKAESEVEIVPAAEEKVVEVEAVEEVGIAPAVIEEKEEVGIIPAEIEEEKEEAGIIPATIEEEKEEVGIIPAEIEEKEDEAGIIPATIEEEKEEVGIIPAEIEEKEEVGIVPAAIEEEKVVDVEVVEEVGIVPAVTEEEKEEVGVIPAEKGVDAELSKEEFAVVEHVVAPSVPVVETETEMPVQPEVAEEEIETADEVEQKLQGPLVASVVLPEAEEASEPVSTLEDFSKPDAVVVEEEVTERDFLVPQVPVEDEILPASAQDEEVVAPTEDVASAISATLESTRNVQEENSEGISPKHVEAIAPLPSIEAIASSEELLDVESEAVLETTEAKPEEPQEAIEEPNATVPVVEAVVQAEDEKVDVIDGNAEGQVVKDEHEALPPSNVPVETETGVIIDEVEGHVEEIENKTSAQVEVAEENVEVGGEPVEVSAAGATSEDLVDETTLANAAEFTVNTAVEPVEVETEIIPGPLTDDLAEAKKEHEDDQMGAEAVEEDVEEVMVKEVEAEPVDEIEEETAKGVEEKEVVVKKVEEVEKAEEVEETEETEEVNKAENEVEIVPAAIEEEKVVEVAVKEVEFAPAAIEEEKKQEVEITSATIEKGIDSELPKEELAIVEPVVPPSVPVVETEIPVAPEVAKEEVETADEVEQKLQGPLVASVVLPEAEEASEPVSALEDISKSDAVVVEEATEHDFLVLQTPVEDEITLASAQDEEVVAPTEDVASAISATLESTRSVQEENSEDISPKDVEVIAPVPSMETIASNDEELLNAESETVLETIEAKPKEAEEVVEETSALVPMVEVIEAEDEKVGVVDESVEGQVVEGEHEALSPSNEPVETETGVIIGEVEGRVAEVEDETSAQVEAHVEVPAEVAEENVEVEGELVEEVSAAGATSEDLVDETTLAVDENTAEFAHKTAVEPVEVSREKGEEPVAAIEEEAASTPPATQPVQTSSEFVEDSAGIEEEVVIERVLSEPTVDLSPVEEVTPEATKGIEEQLEEPMVAIIQDENASPLVIPESAEGAEGKVERVVGVEDVMAKPEDEAPFDTASEVIEEKDGVPAVHMEEEVPTVASEVLLETSLEESPALSTKSFALEAEAGLVEPFDQKEEDAIVEALAPEHTEMTSVDPIVPVEEKEIPAHIPEQEPEAEEVKKADEVTVALEETTPASSVPVEMVESVEVTEENAGERALAIEDEAEPFPAAISEVDLGASSAPVAENSGDGTQVVEEQTALNPEHTAELPTEAVEEAVEPTEPDVEELAAQIEPQAVVISESESLAGAGEDVETVEVVPSPDDAAEEPIITPANVEVAPIPVSVNENVEEKQAMQAEIIPGHLEAAVEQAAVEQVVEIGQKEAPVAEAQLEQPPATDQSVVEAVSVTEPKATSGPIVAPEAADDLIEQGLEIATPTAEETIGPVELGAQHLPASEISVEPVLAITENDAEEPNTVTEEEFLVPASESPSAVGEAVRGLDHQVEEKAIVVDETELHPPSETSEEHIASIPPQAYREESSSSNAVDPTFEDKGVVDTPAVLETLVTPEPVEVMPVLQPTIIPPALETTFEQDTPDQHAATIDDAVEISKIPLISEPETSPTPLAEEVTSHIVSSDSNAPPTFVSGMETDEATENAPKTLEEVLSVDLPNLPAETPLVGPSEDATTADIDMSSGRFDNAVASKEDAPSISALTTENVSVEESSAPTHGEYPSFAEEHVGHFSTAPIAEALEQNVEDGLSEMESHRDVIDDSVLPVLQAEQSLEAPIAQVKELIPLSETQAFVAEPISVPSELFSPEVPAVDGDQETSILVKDDSEALPTPIDKELGTEVSEPTATDSLPDNQNTPLEAAATAVVSHDPSSLTEQHVANEINLPTLVEGVSAAALVESALVSEEQERTSVEVKNVLPVLEGQTTELAKVGVDGDHEGPTIEKPEDEETLAADSFADIADGVGNNDVAPSQELVSDIQSAIPTPISEAEIAETSEELIPLPAVEPVLASTSPVIENLAVPQAEEFISLDTAKEAEAAGDEDSQPIHEELVAEAEANAPPVDPVISAHDAAAVCDSETPVEQPSGAENLFSSEADAETVEDPAPPQEPTVEIDEPTPLQVEESQIAEPEPVLVDSSPIEVELEESVTQKSPIGEAGNVELVPNTPPFEESVAAEDALVEEAPVQEALVEDVQHEELTVVHDIQGAVVSEPNLVDDDGPLESQELIGAEEPDTRPIFEEDSAPVAENQPVDKTAPSNESVVEDSKDEVEAPIAEDSPAVTEIPLEATVPVVAALSLVDERELPTSDVDIGGDFGSAPELTSGSEVDGIDLTISEALEVPKAPEFANVPAEAETLDSAGGGIVDKVPEAEVVTELLDVTTNEQDASKDLEADPIPPSNTAPVGVAEDSTSSSIEVVPQEMDTQTPPIVKADVEPAPYAPSFEGPVAEDAPVEDAQNEESAITQEPIPVHSLHEEIASESSAIDDTALVSQESIATPEESNITPIVEEDSIPVAENQPVDETALPIENVVEESTVELEDPIAVPEPIAEESPAVVEITPEPTIPVVEPLSVVDKPESPAVDAVVSDQAAVVAEDSTDVTELIDESKALNTHGEDDLTTPVEVPKEVAAILAEAESLDSTGDAKGIEVAGSAINAPEAEVSETLDAAANEDHASKDLEADPSPAGEIPPVEITEESTADESTQIVLSSELPLDSEISHVVVDQPTSGATEDLEAEESPTLETDVAGDSTAVEAQLAEEMPPVALEEPTQNESSDAPDVAPTPSDPSSANVVDAEVHADLEEEPTTVTTEGTEISLTPIPVSEEPTAIEADGFTPPNETPIENIQVEEGSTPVTESTVAESIAPAAEEESTMANAQESMEVADVSTDSLHVHEPIVDEPSEINVPIPANDVISDVLAKDLVADTEEALPIITSEEKIHSGAASAPDIEADIVPPAVEVAAEAGPVEDHTFEPEITPIVDSAPLEPPSIEETSKAISVDEAIATHPSSAPIIDNAPFSPGATATEEPVFSDDILNDVSNPTEVEGTALEEASAPTPIEEPTPTEHLTDPILDATVAQEPIAIADVEDIEVKDELSAIESPVATDPAIVEVDPLAEEQTKVEGEPTFTIPPVESVTSENAPALEETTTVINRASDIILDGGQNEVPLLENQSVADNDAEAPVTLAPLDTNSVQDSETVIEEDSNVEDDAPVDGPVPAAEAALPANDSVPLNINDLESTPTAPEETTHIEGTPELVVQEDLPIVHDIAATEIVPPSSIVVEDGPIVEDRPIEAYAPEHIAEEPATTEPLAGAAESLETTEENVVEISAPTDLDPITPPHEDLAGNQDASLVVINEDVHVTPVDVERLTPHEPAVSEDLPIVEDTTATEIVQPSSIVVVEDGPVGADAAEHVPEEPAAETTESLEPSTAEGGNAAAEISVPTEEVVTAAGPDPMTPTDEALVDNPDPSPVVADEDVAPIDVEGSTLHEPTAPEDLLIVEDTAATGVASPSSIVIEDGPVEASVADITEEPTESLETTTAEGPAEILTEEVVTAAEPDSTIPIQEALVDNPDPSPVVVEEDVAPIDVEGSTLHEPTVPEDLLIVEDTATGVASPFSIVVEDGPVEADVADVADEPTESLETTTAESPAEISALTEEVVAAVEPDSTIPIQEALVDNPDPSPVIVEEDVAPIDVETSTPHEPTAPADLFIEDTTATEVAPPSSIVVEGAAEHIAEETAAESTASLEITTAEGENVTAETPAPLEVITAAEADPAIPTHDDLADSQGPSPIFVDEDVAPVDFEVSTPHGPTAPEDLPIVQDTTATEAAPPSSIVIEDGPVETDAAEHIAPESAAVEPTEGENDIAEDTEGENVAAESFVPLEVITAAEADPTIPIHDNLADNQAPSPIVVDEDVAPVDVEVSTPHEPTAPEDLLIVQDTTPTELAPPSSIVVEDEPVETNVAEHIVPESAAVEPTEGENVVAEISAPVEEVTAAGEPDPTPIHEDLIEQDPSPPIVVNENVAPVNVEESAPLEPTPAAVENDLVKSLDVSSNTEATTLVSAPEPNLESAEAEPITGEVEIDEMVPEDLPHQEEDDLPAVPALDHSDTDISSQEFEDIILELETAAAAEVPVSDDNGHLASSGLEDVEGSTVEDDKPVDLDQEIEILAADDTVAAAEVEAEVETPAGNGHSEVSELDKQISVEAPVSNGHGRKIDEVLEVPRPEVQLDSNSAEVSIGNGHDSKVHDVLHAPEVAELSPSTTSAEADATPAIENQ